MTLGFQLDTNIVSEPLRPQPNPRLLARLQQHQHALSIASIVWHELLFGYESLPASTRREALGAYLEEVVAASLPNLPYDDWAAHWHAAERARLAQVGQTPAFVDGQIAAIAAVNDLVLVTASTTDFMNFGDLQVVNWLED